MPLNSVAPATPNQLALLEVRRRALFRVRECFASSADGDPMMVARKKDVVEVLVGLSVAVTDRLEKAVAKTSADKLASRDLLAHLEMTLMAVSPTGPKVLQLVAGISVELPVLWEVKIPLGEGIGGRAARWLDASTYDDEEVAGTVSAGVYLALEKGKRHSWLLAIPLWSEECGRGAKGLQAYRLYSELAPEPAPAANESADLTPQEVTSLFYDRFMAAAEKTAELAGAATLPDTAADSNGR